MTRFAISKPRTALCAAVLLGSGSAALAQSAGTWLVKGGGLLSGKEVPSHRFNAGEKVLFWVGVFLLASVSESDCSVRMRAMSFSPALTASMAPGSPPAFAMSLPRNADSLTRAGSESRPDAHSATSSP